jgi:hypothetical protein
MSAKSGEVGWWGKVDGREIGRKDKFWGKAEVEKPKTLGKEGCVFGSSLKQFQWPHPQLVHWWLQVHFSYSRKCVSHTLKTTSLPSTSNWEYKSNHTGFICGL